MPPYISLWDLDPPFDEIRWGPDRITYSKVISSFYPNPTPFEMLDVLTSKPYRTLWHMIRRGSTIEEATNTACMVINQDLLPECTVDFLVADKDAECDENTAEKTVTFTWSDSEPCQHPLALPEPIIVDCFYVARHGTWGLVLYSVAGINMLSTLGFSIAIYIYRDYKAIKSASHFYCQSKICYNQC